MGIAAWRRALVAMIERLADSVIPSTRSDEASWSDPTNNEIVPREISWTISEETNYGGERLVVRGMEEENAKARLRLLGLSTSDGRRVEPEEEGKLLGETLSIGELDDRLAPDADRTSKAG